jgi:hypothetical protein
MAPKSRYFDTVKLIKSCHTTFTSMERNTFNTYGYAVATSIKVNQQMILGITAV